MHGDMPSSRWWVLPEKMISTRLISVATPIPPQSCRDPRIIASDRTSGLQQRDE
jgi:hypothetical protein